MMGILSQPMCFSPRFSSLNVTSEPEICHFPRKFGNSHAVSRAGVSHSLVSLGSGYFANRRDGAARSFSASASSSSSVESAEYVEEPVTKVKFSKYLSIADCSAPLTLLGTGYREKVIAIIGVKVYAAALYIDESILKALDNWRGRSGNEIQNDPSGFSSIFQVSSDKTLQITMVRDVDGKTFWDALDEAVSPRIRSPSAGDKTALSMFRDIFRDRSLNKGARVFLTWSNASQLLVSIAARGMPSSAGTMIESVKVNSAIFDVFFGDSPVSPTLKTSVSNQLAKFLE